MVGNWHMWDSNISMPSSFTCPNSPSLRGSRRTHSARECISGRKPPCEGPLIEARGDTVVKGTQRTENKGRSKGLIRVTGRSPNLRRVRSKDSSQSELEVWRRKVRSQGP